MKTLSVISQLGNVFNLRTVGILRALFGLVFVLKPEKLARGWVGEDSTIPTAMSRSVAARDLAIGVGLAATPSPTWLGASLLSDLTDGAETFTDSIPSERKRSVRLWAFGFALFSIASALVGRCR